MNQLRDAWRIKWRAKEGNRDFGYHHEGIWSTSFEMTASSAARHVSIWLANSFTIPLGEENYPLIWETTVFRMDCGTAVEAARMVIMRERERGGRFKFSDGTPIYGEETPLGSSLETEDGWTRVRKN